MRSTERLVQRCAEPIPFERPAARCDDPGMHPFVKGMASAFVRRGAHRRDGRAQAGPPAPPGIPQAAVWLRRPALRAVHPRRIRQGAYDEARAALTQPTGETVRLVRIGADRIMPLLRVSFRTPDPTRRLGGHRHRQPLGGNGPDGPEPPSGLGVAGVRSRRGRHDRGAVPAQGGAQRGPVRPDGAALGRVAASLCRRTRQGRHRTAGGVARHQPPAGGHPRARAGRSAAGSWARAALPTGSRKVLAGAACPRLGRMKGTGSWRPPPGSNGLRAPRTRDGLLEE